MKKVIKVVVIVLILGGITAGIGVTLANNKNKMEEEAKLSQITAKSIPVVISKVKAVKLGKDFEISGTFNPTREMRFNADVQGKALQVLVEKGQQVYEGQLLVKLDDQDLQRDLKLAKVNYSQAKRDLERFTALKAGEGITAQQLEQTRLQFRQSEIQIEKIQAKINKMAIKAPIAGVVTQKMIEKGSFISPGTPLVEITDIQQLKMVVKLAESEAVQVTKGQTVAVKANVYPDKVHQGRISTIAVKADASKKYDVEIDINNNDNKALIRAGMQGTANFKFDKAAEVLMIPRKAIVGSLQDAKVYVATADNKAKLITIETGITHQNMVQVTKGLTTADRVITSGQINLQNGTKVSVLKK
ncbi:hypothetical protein BKI52_44400 [marine bacterium AO1-C]|nr:hypothetical protein BKI52_44400 [marine bacterium AO1-C]